MKAPLRPGSVGIFDAARETAVRVDGKQRVRRRCTPDDYGGGRFRFLSRGQINEASMIAPEIRVCLVADDANRR